MEEVTLMDSNIGIFSEEIEVTGTDTTTDSNITSTDNNNSNASISSNTYTDATAEDVPLPTWMRYLPKPPWKEKGKELNTATNSSNNLHICRTNIIKQNRKTRLYCPYSNNNNKYNTNKSKLRKEHNMDEANELFSYMKTK